MSHLGRAISTSEYSDHLLKQGSLAVRKENYLIKKFILLASAVILSQQCSGTTADLAQLSQISLEELGNIKVTSVSKKEEKLKQAAASIYVITNQAIQRSGAQSLPEVLRLAPNLLVAQISANQYAISARGFNSSTANKLLVLMDGRTLYTPLYSGVFWDAQGIMLEDIDRIEVISGSGGTLWGANAVNGVINIITKKSSDTKGNLLSTKLGNNGEYLAIRHGQEFENIDGSYRVYANFNKWLESHRKDGSDAEDNWDKQQIGFRSDWASNSNLYTLQGDTYQSQIELPQQNASNSGANILGRWVSQFRQGGEMKLQVYIDHSNRDFPGTYNEQLNIIDIDAQHSLPINNGSQLIWGGGYRIASDHVGHGEQLAFYPVDKTLHWVNIFAQQKRPLAKKIDLIIGAKLEHNDYTGIEFLPQGKLVWSPDKNSLLWLNLARSIRAPSRIDRELYAPASPPYLLAGNENFQSEIAKTLELGWRSQWRNALTYSLVFFHTDYKKLRSLDIQNNGTYLLQNNVKGNVQGIEASLGYSLSPSWSIESAITSLNENFETPGTPTNQGYDPSLQWSFGTQWKPNNDQLLGINIRHVGGLDSTAITPYTVADFFYENNLYKNLIVTVAGKNLAQNDHPEFPSGGTQSENPVEIEPSLTVSMVVQF